MHRTSWKARWSAFLDITFDPWVLLLFTAGMVLSVVLVRQENPEAVAALTLMLSLISGVLGGLLTARWTNITDERTIVARGKVAVRSLKLLLSNLAALDRRACTYLERCKQPDPDAPLNREVVVTYLEEVIGRCEVLEEEALSSIENWTDIIPEADIRTQIGVISQLKEEVGQRAADLQNLSTQLAEVQGRSEEKERELRKEMAGKEKELSRLRKDLQERQYSFGSVVDVGSGYGIGTGSLGSVSGGALNLSHLTSSCNKCGYSTQGLVIGGCPKCGHALS